MPKLTKQQKLARRFYKELRKLDSEAPNKFKEKLKIVNKGRYGIEKARTLAETLIAYSEREKEPKVITSCSSILLLTIPWSMGDEGVYWSKLHAKMRKII